MSIPLASTRNQLRTSLSLIGADQRRFHAMHSHTPPTNAPGIERPAIFQFLIFQFCSACEILRIDPPAIARLGGKLFREPLSSDERSLPMNARSL